MNPLKFAAILIALASSANAALAEMTRVVAHGRAIEVRAGVPPTIVIAEQTAMEVHEAEFLSIVGIYEGSGRTYVLFQIDTNGSACPILFAGLDVSERNVKLSKSFGTCGTMPVADVRDGALVVELPSSDGKNIEAFRFKDGQFSESIAPISLAGTGPATAPGGDLAAYVDGKHPATAIKLQAVQLALRSIMPDAAFDAARDLILTDRGRTFKADDNYAIGWACENQNCGAHTIAFAFDHEGRAWALVRRDKLVTFYGTPNEAVRQRLSAEE